MITFPCSVPWGRGIRDAVLSEGYDKGRSNGEQTERTTYKRRTRTKTDMMNALSVPLIPV